MIASKARHWSRLLLAASLVVVSATAATSQEAKEQTAGKPTEAQSGSQEQTPALKEVDVAAGSFSRDARHPAWVEELAMPNADTSAPVAGRLSDTQIMVSETPAVHTRLAITVNDVSMLTTVGQVSINFVPQYQKLHLHRVLVLRGNEKLDRTASSNVRFLQRESGLEKGVYSDVVTASVLVNDLRVGDTLEYAYTLHGDNPVFGGKFSDNANWDMPFKTGVRRVIVSHPENRKVAWRVVGDSQPKALTPKETTKDGLRQLHFEEHDLPEVTPEQGAPADAMPYRWLHFSEYADWQEVAGWARALFVVKEHSDAELQAKIAELKQAATDDERVSKALQYVQSEIRYFSVALGESSHRPAQPSAVLKQRYGDCKDKSLLLVTILKELGIESYPVLLSTGRRKALDLSLPSPGVFDHAIVQAKLNGKTYYLDATRLGQYGRLDRLGQAHEGSQVLVVADGARELQTITSPNAAELQRSELAETMVLPELTGDADLKSRQVWKGTGAEGMRVGFHLASKERIAKSFTDAMESRYTGAKLVGEPQVEDDRENNVFVVTTQYSLPKPLSEGDDYWYVRFSHSNLSGALTQSPSSQRKSPLAVPLFPFEGKYSIEVQFPDGVNVNAAPFAHSVKNKHFSYSASATFRGNVAKTTVNLKTFADRVQPDNLKAFNEDLTSTSKNVGAAIILPKRFARSKKIAKKAAKVAYAEALRGQAKEGIAKLSDTIKSGGLSGSDLANAYCERSSRHLYLGQVKEAFADVEKAIKAAPNSARALASRGDAHFHAGEFDKAIADYSTALSFGDTSGQLYQARGVSRFYAGKFEEAAEDLAKASNTLDQDARVMSDAWLASAYLRLGKPLPTELAERASAAPRGDWPRPALATLAGKLTPDDLLKSLDKKKGDEAVTAKAEGFFYLGQFYVANGDKMKAREFFDKARKLDVITGREHVAAGHELKALPEEPEPVAAAPAEAVPPASNGAATQQAAPIATGTVGPDTPTAPADGAAIAEPPAKAAKIVKRRKRAPDIDPDWNTRPLR